MNVIHENVLVEMPEIEKMKNGVALPDTEIQSQRSGKVIRYGEALPEEVKTLLNSKPKVEFKEYYDGGKIERNGKTYFIMNYKDLLIIE